jgi:hypothetical protein
MPSVAFGVTAITAAVAEAARVGYGGAITFVTEASRHIGRHIQRRQGRAHWNSFEILQLSDRLA